ncbi:MAG: CDP-diacylglycerol--serine O-phosphatidyltransferase [Verrucomicrobia bacterium]|nr:CDP-diacylglycerol--serine O-phosphatidyltransferase [Verrucomicrobiota bacterium]
MSAPQRPPLIDEDYEPPLDPATASRIYFLPNLMTAGNLFCGFVAVIMCIQAHYAMRSSDVITLEAADLFRRAVWLIFGAMAFDALDGRLARMGGKESLFGAEFDSLADIVSFGLAPALMVFFLILSPTQGYPHFREIGWLLGFIYLLCAAIRLARFNVITHPLLQKPGVRMNKDFVGLPVPAAAGTVAALVLFLLNLAAHERDLQRWALVLPVLMLLIAFLMVSTVRYPSGKQIDMQTKTKLTTLIFYVVSAAAVVVYKEFGMLICCFGYIFYGLFRHLRRPKLVSGIPTTPSNTNSNPPL